MVMTLIGANCTPVTVAGRAIAIVIAVVSVAVVLSFTAHGPRGIPDSGVPPLISGPPD